MKGADGKKKYRLTTPSEFILNVFSIYPILAEAEKKGKKSIEGETRSWKNNSKEFYRPLN